VWTVGLIKKQSTFSIRWHTQTVCIHETIKNATNERNIRSNVNFVHATLL